MSTRRTLEEQIELARKELKEKEARIKQLLARQRSQADKERTHRLCKRGGLVEKLLPGLAAINDEQFDAFVKRTLLSGYAEKTLKEIANPNSLPNAKLANLPQSIGAGGNGNSGNRTPQAG